MNQLHWLEFDGAVGSCITILGAAAYSDVILSFLNSAIAVALSFLCLFLLFDFKTKNTTAPMLHNKHNPPTTIIATIITVLSDSGDDCNEEIGFVSVNESEVDDDDGVSTEHTQSPTLASLGCRLRGGGTFEHWPTTWAFAGHVVSLDGSHDSVKGHQLQLIVGSLIQSRQVLCALHCAAWQ